MVLFRFRTRKGELEVTTKNARKQPDILCVSADICAYTNCSINLCNHIIPIPM